MPRTAVLAAPEVRIGALLGVIEPTGTPKATEDPHEYSPPNLPKPLKPLDVWLL